MAIKKPIIEQPFTTEFGTVNVGDVVVAVTTGYSHRVSVKKGRYLGYTESQGRHGQTEKKVKLEVQSYRKAWYYKGTDTEWKWSHGNYYQVKDQLETRQVPYFRKTTLRRNRIVPIKDSDHSIVETI